MTRQLPWLEANTPFPAPELAWSDPPGLLAAGGDLSLPRLQAAYRHAIFPWYSAGDPILWWSPDPRCVIAPAQFQASRSLRKQARQPDWAFSVNRAFTNVVSACAEPRAYAQETWINTDIVQAYTALHHAGAAHSIEVWHKHTLVGGLYGVSVGRMFCGESMFSRRTDASKLAFSALMTLSKHWQLPLVDCQLENPHLVSLGAKMMMRSDYLDILHSVRDQPMPDWSQAPELLAEAGFSLYAPSPLASVPDSAPTSPAPATTGTHHRSSS